MKHTNLTVAILLLLAGPVSVQAEDRVVLAEEPVVLEAVSETVVSETVVTATEAAEPARPATAYPMHDMRMMHKGKGHHGKGQGGMKHGGGKGKGHHEKHAQVVKRLDMIEARLAKIEAMLETLVRR